MKDIFPLRCYSRTHLINLLTSRSYNNCNIFNDRQYGLRSRRSTGDLSYVCLWVANFLWEPCINVVVDSISSKIDPVIADVPFVLTEVLRNKLISLIENLFCGGYAERPRRLIFYVASYFNILLGLPTGWAMLTIQTPKPQ